MEEYIERGINFTCCDLASTLIGMEKSELMEGIEMGPSFYVADLLMEYREQNQLIISL
jgi:predicted peroxiredoxin